ncbi:MAG: alpha/beta hydrolase [Chloroflexi bacterium]|nr:alpha/beta hydrolase [Chloroflexota bacterium]MCY4246636.1 alpha/beta hydrolase [Chloroflexota bacterium]
MLSLMKYLAALALPLLCVTAAQMQEEGDSLLSATDYANFPYLAPDLHYEYGDDPQQFAELYLPASPSPHPVIALVHGGCYFETYDLKPVSSIARALADAGFAVWNIEYRRAVNGGEYPNMFLDVGAAVDALPMIADEHDLDLSGLIAIGHSAGGHLALWLAGRGQLDETSALYRAEPLDVAGVVALAPLADIAAALEQGMCGPALPFVMGGGQPTFAEHIRDGSPRALLPLDARQVIIVGDQDGMILPNVHRYLEAAEEAGDEPALILLEGAGHYEIVAVDAPEWQSVLESIFALHAAIRDQRA